jgi:hypothetical protein
MSTYITRPNEGDNSMSTVYKNTPSTMDYNNMTNWKLKGGIQRKSMRSKKSRKSRKSRKTGKSRKSRKTTRK